ncbi:MAG: signal peptide peptidase SppA [Archangium sp.]|nr:signal peptide peptidase SppA [Archangium sp.]
MNESMPVLASSPPPRRRSSAPLFLIGCGLFVMLAVGGVVAATVVGNTVTVDDRAVLRITLGGDIPEFVHAEGFDDLFGTKPVTVRQHVLNLKKAAVDTRVKGVVLRLEPLAIGWAKIEELRDALTDFKKSGKFVIAYSEFMTEKEYALALAADTIAMPPDSRFEFNGLAMDLAHYPGLLEKLGIEVQYFRYGKYKSASGQQFGMKAFTEPVKEMLNDELNGVFNSFLDAVSTARGLEKPELLKLIDEAGEKADWALEKKLIDTVAYWDDIEATVRTKAGIDADAKIKWLSAAKYRDVDPVSAGLPKGKHTFALVYSVGLIVSGKGDGASPFGGDTQGSTPLIAALRDAVDDDSVKAIILRVDSPGGAGLGCDYVRREVEKARAKKPVIVSMSDVAASGGYWVSMDASGIVAQPSTYTGSIGIFSVVPSLGGLYEKMGLNNETFKVGAHADAVIGARVMTPDEAKHFDSDLYASYKRFVDLAAKGRGKTFDELEAVAQGRTWLGTQALANGLVDRLGGFDAAIALGKEKANIAADDTVQLRLFDKKKTFVQQLLSQDDEDDTAPSMSVADAVLKRAVELTGAAPLLRRFPGLGAFAGQVLAGETTFPLMEYRPVIR